MIKVYFDTKEAQKALKEALRFASGSELLRNMLYVTADGGKVSFNASSLDSGIRKNLVISSADDFQAIFPANELNAILSRVKTERLDIEFDPKSLKASYKAGRLEGEIITMDPLEYPTFQTPEEDGIEFDAKELAACFEYLQHFLMKDSARAHLYGIILDFHTEGQITCYSTNGHAMQRYIMAGVSAPEGIVDKKLLISADVIPSIISVLRSETSSSLDATAVLRWNDFRIGLEVEGTTVYTNRIDGSQPDFDRIIPAKYALKCIELDRDELLDAIRDMKTIGDKVRKLVILSIGEGKISMSSERQAGIGKVNDGIHASAKVDLDVDFSGKPARIGINVDYLESLISAVWTNKVQIGFKDHLSPFAAWPVGSDVDCISLAMPMRI